MAPRLFHLLVLALILLTASTVDAQRPKGYRESRAVDEAADVPDVRRMEDIVVDKKDQGGLGGLGGK